MSKVILFAACSIDGFIARPDGNLDWLDAIPNPDNIDYGYTELLVNTSSIIMGRKTYIDLLSFGIEWPYTGIKTFVVSSNPSLKTDTPDTETLTGDIASAVKKIRSNQEKDIWLAGGGQIVTYFLDNELIDRMIISIIPIILGNGIQLFPNKPKETNWILVESKAYSTGVAILTYDKK
jgi:dihydrofolate reductase